MAGNDLLRTLTGGSSSSALARALAASAPQQSHHSLLGKIGGDIGGFVDHLGTDIRDSAVGLPAGIIHLVEHPVGSVEAMGKSTWQDWSPLFEGHFKQFGHNFYAHPLAPILDVASVLTGGAGAAAKLGDLGMAAHVLSEESKLGRIAKFAKAEPMEYTKEVKGIDPITGKTVETEAPKWTRSTSKNPLTKYSQQKIHELVTKTAPHLPGWFGDVMTPEARYDRLETKMMAPRAAALRTQIATFVRAGKDLTGKYAKDFQKKVLVHSYNQLDYMARPLAAHKALPDGWRYIEDEPAKSTAHVQAQATFNMHAGKLKGIRSAISKQHGVIISDAKMAKQELRVAKDQLKAAKLAKRPANVYRPKVEMLQNYLKTDANMRDAAKVLGKHNIAKNAARDKFFAPGESIESDMKGFSRRYTTDDISKAKIDANGNAMIVPLHTLEKFGVEGANASKTLKMLYSKPTQVWKYILQGASPGFFVHNAVGNFLMYAMGHGGTAGFKGMVDALAQTKGEAAAIRSMGAASHALNPHWMEKNFRDQLNNTFAGTQGLRGKLYKYSMYRPTHAVADQFLRRAAINAEMRRAPEVQALMKRGMSYDQAAEQALKSDTGKVLRDRVSQRVMDTMGDYHSMNAGERVAATVMPFYTWNRHALRFTKAAFRDHPVSLDAAANVSRQGVEETKKALGNIPSFLLGSVPLSMLGVKPGKDGRLPIAETTSINPLSTAPDLFDIARAVGGSKQVKPGEAIGSQLGPILQGGIQYLTGTNLQTGVPMKRKPGGLLGEVASDAYGNLPMVDLLKKAIEGNPQPKPNATTGKTQPFLFAKDKSADISSILGVPMRKMDTSAAQRLYDKEIGKKKGRRSGNALLQLLQSS